MVTIYHNPRCRKSRETLEIISNKGIEPVVVEYLQNPPEAEKIASLLDRMGIDDPRQAMRKNEIIYKQLNLNDETKSRTALIEAMAQNPILIERPIVVTDKGARICRPPELVEDIL